MKYLLGLVFTLAIVTQAFAECKPDPNYKYASKWAIEEYRYLIALEKTEEVKKLVCSGVPFRGLASEGKYTLTPLLMSASTENDELTIFLIDKGADVNVVSKDGFSALRFAVLFKNVELVNFLLKKGALATGPAAISAVFDAARLGSVPILKSLVAKGADTKLAPEGHTPLMVASNRATSEFLIKQSGGVNTKDNEGRTALNYAIVRNKPELVKILIENGAKTNNVDNDGNPLSYYVDKYVEDNEIRKEILRLLNDNSVNARLTVRQSLCDGYCLRAGSS